MPKAPHVANGLSQVAPMYKSRALDRNKQLLDGVVAGVPVW